MSCNFAFRSSGSNHLNFFKFTRSFSDKWALAYIAQQRRLLLAFYACLQVRILQSVKDLSNHRYMLHELAIRHLIGDILFKFGGKLQMVKFTER